MCLISELYDSMHISREIYAGFRSIEAAGALLARGVITRQELDPILIAARESGCAPVAFDELFKRLLDRKGIGFTVALAVQPFAVAAIPHPVAAPQTATPAAALLAHTSTQTTLNWYQELIHKPGRN